MTTNTLTKNAGSLGWNASAVSIDTIPASTNGEVTFSFVADAQGIVAGLNEVSDSAGSGYVEISYGLHATSNTVRVIESGYVKTSEYSYIQTDVFKITRKDDVVYYLKNDVVFYVSATHSTAEMLLDASLYAVDDAILNADIVSGSVSVDIVINITGPVYELSGYGGPNIVAGMPGPTYEMEGFGMFGANGQGVLSGPAYEIELELIAEPLIQGDLSGPVYEFDNKSIAISGPVYVFESRAPKTIGGLTEATVMNMRTNEVTRYTNFGFMHIIQIGNKYYGVKTDGLYLLEGSTDSGSAISSSITTMETDFGTNQHKRVQHAVLDTETATTITPIVEGVTKTGHASSFGGRRTTMALGNQGRFWKFKVDGIVKLTGIEFITDKLKRKL